MYRPLKTAIQLGKDYAMKEAVKEAKALAADNTELALAKLEVFKAKQRRAGFREQDFWLEVYRSVQKGDTLKEAVRREIEETGYKPRSVK